MTRVRSILALCIVLALAALRPTHWAAHALGAHQGCADAQVVHACCEHDHGDEPVTPSERTPDRHGGDSECELCAAMAVLHADLPNLSIIAVIDLAPDRDVPSLAQVPTLVPAHAALGARPPPHHAA